MDFVTSYYFIFVTEKYMMQVKQNAKLKGIFLSPIDIERYRNRFNVADKDKKGFITRVDIENLLKVRMKSLKPLLFQAV